MTALNKLLQDTELAEKSLEAVMKATYDDSDRSSVFNNAAQVWNHTFFWNCMKPGGGGAPIEQLAKHITQAFGSFKKFKEEFKNAGATQFGSGYVWLVLDNNQLKVVQTANAVNPLVNNQAPLLTCDVWEHAYYLDYQNLRPDFLQAFLDYLINWDFVAQHFARAKLAVAGL